MAPTIASGLFFSAQYSGGNEKLGLPVAPLPHDSRSLRSPTRFNSLTGTVWTAFRSIKDVLSNSILFQKPLAMFAIAIPHNWDKVVVQAVRFVLQHPLKFTEERLEELKRISGTGYHNLLSYHRLCGDAAKKTLTFAFHNPMARHMSDFPFGAAAPSGRSPPFFLPTPFFGDEYWMVLLPASWTITRSATKSKSRRAML
ncbi:hypothetical protein ARMSODRAFT_309677 [Armillaria solidipes]|uniref:Uncharacterized protein n=1 Tax=Armillaria solidipes TaxID=1076256 RepID=A0A2H3BKA5_9AGAR|nr:hypothetical protein ARMSODRAFT_309677 [Armillaria solidipes]